MKEPTMISKMRSGRYGKSMAGMGILLFVLVLLAAQAHAVILPTSNPNLAVRFDNTITYSVVSRLSSQDADLIADPNTDDGNRNFDTGLVMNRFDLLSELDVVYNRAYGFRVSGAGWYDFVYNTSNDNDSPLTANAYSVAHDEFTDDTKRLHGRDAELLEAMVFGKVDLGDTTLRVRAGQFTQWWGDSFFLGWNGVAGALLPVDVSKAATLPNVQLKELIRPVPQVSASLQVTDNLSLDGYYQFEWEPARLFASGSYFSPADLIGPGAERILAGPDNTGLAFIKTANSNPSDSGQFGISAKFITMAATYGLYYNKFHSKDFLVTVGLSPLMVDGEMVIGPDGPVILPDYYYFLYPEDIESYAASANFAWGQYTFSGEVTYRTNVPLQSEPTEILAFHVTPEYATGDTLSVILNTFSGGMRGNFFCDSQDLIAEIAYVTELSADKEELKTPGYDKDGLGAKVVYEPAWYQVLPGLDLSLPMGIEYAFKGKPSTILWGMGTHEGGSFNIGVGGTYNAVWEMELTYRNFFGDTDYQPHADRDYASFYIRRAF